MVNRKVCKLNVAYLTKIIFKNFFFHSVGVKQLPYRVVQAVPLPVLNIESIRSLILFDSTNTPHLYPADIPLLSKPPPVYIYIANPTNGMFQGFTVDVPISGIVRHILFNIKIIYVIYINIHL